MGPNSTTDTLRSKYTKRKSASRSAAMWAQIREPGALSPNGYYTGAAPALIAARAQCAPLSLVFRVLPATAFASVRRRGECFPNLRNQGEPLERTPVNPDATRADRSAESSRLSDSSLEAGVAYGIACRTRNAAPRGKRPF